MKYLGCAYYPEYWGPARVAVDARLMRAAGINIVRIGEFAWSRMEPREGQYTADWLHHCVDVLGRYDISVILCTPTATPPSWLTTAYPDVLLVRSDGTRAIHGFRRHACSSSDTYRRHSARITEVLSREMARHKNVVAWQLDNELGPEMGWCHCGNCQARFQAWLQEKYGTIAELNARWKTGFWSMDFSDWREIRLEDGRTEVFSAQKLDSRRFWSWLMIDFARSQSAIIRKNHPAALVTTNGMSPLFPFIDYYELFRDLDVASDDLYFDIGTMDVNTVGMNTFRALKPGRRYWLTETGAAALDHGKPPHQDQFRAWAWSSFAHGAEAHLLFRWRTCLSGQEQELQGILERSGKPRHRYRAVRRCFQEFATLRKRFKDLPLPKADVAIVQDYQTLWGYESSRVGKEIDYPGLIYGLHKALYRCNIQDDLVSPVADLRRYKVVILPSLMMIDETFAGALRAFIRKGGHVLALGQIGIRDCYDNYLPEPGPAHMADLLGAHIEGGMYLRSHVGPDEALSVPAAAETQAEVTMRGAWNGRPVEGVARRWIGDITLAGGRALLSFADDAYRGQPAVVEKRTGRGCLTYVAAARLDDGLTDTVLSQVLGAAGVRKGPQAPLHVEVVKRGRVTFVINHTASPVTVKLGSKGQAMLGRYADGKAALRAYGVCVVKGGSPQPAAP